ncbi:LOW QUALITY PROTEIN: uncharacterized protein ACOB7L_007425, partial [Callospermophilus lateralis]
WVVLEEAPRVVAALSEDMKPGHLPYGFPWELVVCTALGFFAVLSLFWRGFQSVRSRLYVGREKRLALNLAGLIEAKCGLLEKVSLVEKEHEGLESSLKDCRFEKGSREAQQLEATDEKLHRSESSHGVEMLFLEEELKAQKAQQGQQDETIAHLSRRIQSLQGESESLRSQIAEAKTNWRLFQVNEEELKLAIKELKASLEILEGGRNQKCTFSSEVEKTTEDLTEHLKSLQTEQASLQSENAQLQSENETLQENFKVMMERYQENMMKLHRKLRVEENYRVEQEEKLSKVEEKMSHTIKELETYRKRAQYLEEQLQSTIRSCLGKIISSEKEADASELAARIAERNLSYFRKHNARNRQKLTEKELRFELVEKDPYDALDVSNSAMGRKPSLNGPSPIGHPSSERRPPHFEKSGPLTLSPFTPVGGGRGSRGPGNRLDHATSSKGRESSCHKFTDFQRAPSQTGPLSPPGEQASRLMIPPPGQPYSSDARLPLQRQDRFYSNCGRASGPAEHRIPNMPPLDSDWVVLEEAPRVVAALSEDMKPGHLPYGFPWELVVCTALGFFAVLSLFWRGFQSVRSRLYVGREKRLALNLAGLIEAKCGLLEKVSLVEKEHEGLESSLKDCRFEKGSREAQQLEATDEKLHRSESSHGIEMLFLEEELKAQKAQQGQQDETMAHLSRRIQSLQGESESLRSQIAEAKTNWRLFQVNEEELKLAIKEDESKGALRNLVYGDKLKASLEILEGGRNQKCTFSSEVEKTTEDLTEHLKSLQTEQASLQSENAQLQSENETLQENFKVMMERYQENMMKLHRKLRVEENYRVEQEEKLSKVEEKMSHTIKELETYRKRAQYLEEQLQSTIRSCLGKIISSEKEADASELAARIAERNLSYFRKHNAHNRQKLTEKELRFELVEKDPYDALDVSNSAMGRKPSLNGPSPIGHPSSEKRPPHFEKSGPLTLSPFTPVGGGRGSRGPGNPLDHATSSKGRESSCHKFTDFQRAPSQTGPLSPPGEQASRLMIPPPGQPYSSDARLPLQRQDRFYSNCGRASGPAEHRIPNMPPLDSDWVVLEEAPRVVAALSEDMKPGHLPYGFPWELVVCTALGFFAVLSLFWRGFQSVRSRLYVGREKRLALNLAGLIEAKCGLLEKVSLVEKEHEGLESSLKDCRFEKGSREAQQLEATDEKLHRSESSHGVEMLFLEEELKAQKAQQGQQDETMAHLSRRIQSLQGESESLRSQIAEAKTNWRLFQVNEEELKLAIKEDESKGALRNLVYGDKLKASLEILEGGRNQKCTFSSEVEKTTEVLTEHLKSLQTEQASLQSENAQLQSENETLQENFKVMMERYQENMMKLHRKLRVEENYRVEQEEKLSKVEEKMSHTIKELETYRKRAQYLEEQLQSTIRSCLGKIISSEKEADASELAARIAERNLSYFRKHNARNRQKLTEKELRFELVEKDPYDALDVSNSAMGRKPSLNGPSPIGHPSSERRPPHFEKSGPLTLSPFTPVGGGRGSRGPGNPLDHATSSKGRESSCHKFTDFQRAPSQTGPLSPPGEQASRLMIPPPCQPYSSDARLPLQRQDRFYSNCGRASGPAEHRIPNMPPLDSDVNRL